ncbi:unnamed protein product, partial [Prorocentrum cordatum]
AMESDGHREAAAAATLEALEAMPTFPSQEVRALVMAMECPHYLEVAHSLQRNWSRFVPMWMQYKQINRVENRADDQDKRLDRIENQIAQLRQELQVVQSEEPQPPLRPISGSSFNREIDRSVVVIRSPKLVTKSNMQNALADWLRDCNINEQEYTFDEQEPAGIIFTMRFAGAKNYAERKVNQVLGALKTPSPGNAPPIWRSFRAESIADGTVNLFVGPDKNTEMARRELGCKKIKGVLVREFPQKRFFLERHEGEILLGRKPICKAVPVEGQDMPNLLRAKESMRAEGMDAQRIQQLAADAFGPVT